MDRYAIVENGIVTNVAVSESALADNWIPSEVAQIGWSYADDEFAAPPVIVVVPTEVPALSGLLAIDAAGLASAYTDWADSMDRTFAERAFIDKATVWRRNDPVLLAGAAALGLTSQNLDDLFVLAAGL